VDWGARPGAAARFQVKRAACCVADARLRLHESDTRFVPFGAAGYPREFAQLRHPPAGLFVRGSIDLLERVLRAPRITIVGTRRATPYGNRVADLFATAFVDQAVVVVSGLALGIDGRAHRAALEAGGVTVAILGCGTDVVYPTRHQSLYERVVREGLVLSELPPGTRPARWTFPARNRLLAALGDAVLVVEGSRVSGALQTAGAALELGRPVFAVPGQITGENHQGCNWLIYDGAAPAVDPCVTVEEFFQRTRIERSERQLGVPMHSLPGSTDAAACGSPAEVSVLQVLTTGEWSVDALAFHTGLGTRQVLASLARIEISGLAVRCGGGRYTRAP
jgi:DNA processing protein